MTRRTLFSVIEVTPNDGDPFRYVEWHADILPALEEFGPEGKAADHVIDFAEELLDLLEDEDC